MPTPVKTANQPINQQFQSSMLLTPAEIETLLAKLARGHIGTMQEEYAELKKVLCYRRPGIV